MGFLWHDTRTNFIALTPLKMLDKFVEFVCLPVVTCIWRTAYPRLNEIWTLRDCPLNFAIGCLGST